MCVEAPLCARLCSQQSSQQHRQSPALVERVLAVCFSSLSFLPRHSFFFLEPNFFFFSLFSTLIISVKISSPLRIAGHVMVVHSEPAQVHFLCKQLSGTGKPPDRPWPALSCRIPDLQRRLRDFVSAFRREGGYSSCLS